MNPSVKLLLDADWQRKALRMVVPTLKVGCAVVGLASAYAPTPTLSQTYFRLTNPIAPTNPT
jgi:hypothetical protein